MVDPPSGESPPAKTVMAAQGLPRVAIVVPTFNEKENIREFERRLEPVLKAAGGKMTVLFVDDNSPDGTGAEIKSLMATNPAYGILEREGKKGLGTAYIDGFRNVLESRDPDVVVQMDADLQHPPEILAALVSQVASGAADVAIASRHIDEGSFMGLSLSRRVISKGASWYSRKVLGLKVKDTTTGFKALKKSAVECLLAHPPRSSGFVYQVESLYILSKNGFAFVEVPFTFEERTRGVSKMGTGEIVQFFFGIFGIRFRRY